VLCAAFCGAGKTYICNNTDIKAVEIEYWKYKEKRLQKDYVEDVKKHFGKVDYIFISTEPDGMKLLNDEGFDITLVYPMFIQKMNSETNIWIDILIEIVLMIL